jgi:5-methylcytosine-specific restriction endonuclease McrA
VFEREGVRCSYVDGRGQRCRETNRLELHHLIPFARDGANVSANLALFCRAHNTLAAEEDFGRSFVESKREKVSHESWTVQKPA